MYQTSSGRHLSLLLLKISPSTSLFLHVAVIACLVQLEVFVSCGMVIG